MFTCRVVRIFIFYTKKYHVFYIRLINLFATEQVLILKFVD